jgi:recombination protein RecA
MPTASMLRHQIETGLAHRIPSALTPVLRRIRPVAASRIRAVDELLDGGLPLGAITEIVGPQCSGRTSLALSFIAGMTQTEKVCAWIDVSDGLDPESAVEAGVNLSRLLWVRCGVQPASSVKPRARQPFSLPEKYLAPPATRKGLHGGGFGPHPRDETKGIPVALSNLLRSQISAPGHIESQENGSSETEGLASGTFRMEAKSRRPAAPSCNPLSRIEQALRVADLLLQGGGFSAIVLDMSSIASEFSSRVPLATWFRYRAAAEKTQASFVLLTQHPCAKSSAELLLRLHPGTARCDEVTVFSGIEHHLEVTRRRFLEHSEKVVPLRKPPQRAMIANWQSQTAWVGRR